MKQLGYYTGIKTRRPNIVSNFVSMPKIKQEKAESKPPNGNEEDFKNLINPLTNTYIHLINLSATFFCSF